MHPHQRSSIGIGIRIESYGAEGRLALDASSDGLGRDHDVAIGLLGRDRYRHNDRDARLCLRPFVSRSHDRRGC